MIRRTTICYYSRHYLLRHRARYARFVEGPVLFLSVAIFVGFGYGAVTTSLQALAVQSTAIQRSGYATATYFTMFDLGIALGSYILGMVAVQAGYASVYLSGAGLLGVVFIIYLLRLAKMKPKNSEYIVKQLGLSQLFYDYRQSCSVAVLDQNMV